MIYGLDTFSFHDVLEICKAPNKAKLNKAAKEQIPKSQNNVQQIVERERHEQEILLAKTEE